MPMQAFQRGNEALQQRRLDEAIAQYDAALRVKGDFVEALTNRGVALRLAGRLEEAVASFEQALRHQPSHVSAHVNKGNALKDLGRPAEAEAAYDAALALDPRHADALANKAVLLRQAKDAAGALALAERALAVRPNHAMAMNTRGSALNDLKRFDEALAAFEGALALVPSYAEARCNQGLALRALKRHEEALAAFTAALALRADYPEALTGQGESLISLRRYAEAEGPLARALALKSDMHQAASALGIAQVMQGRQEEGLRSYALALAHAPQTAEYHNNCGFALQELGRLDEAQAAYDRALACDATFADARTNRGIVRLLSGDWPGGFADFESRWNSPNFASPRPPCAVPLWDGAPVGHVLIHGEQGLGDHLQFIRYLPEVCARAERVTMACTPKLHALFARAFPQVRFITTVMPEDRFDAMAALLSLPHLFGTRLDTVPLREGYLRADPARVSAWQERLGPGQKIGIVWQGNPQPDVDRGRSVPLAALAPVAREGLRLIALQKNFGLDQLNHLPTGMAVETLGPDFDEGPDAFEDSAAVMMQCDAVVTSDTSVPHLAGALGRPTFLLLKKIPDWRWQTSGKDNPFYARMRVFRQTTAGDWSAPVAALADALHRSLA